MKLFLKTVDWIAVMIAVLAITVLLPVLVFQEIVGVFGALGSMFRHPNDIIILLIVTAAFAWCTFRWKELNKRE